MHPDMPPRLHVLADVLLTRPFVAPPASNPLVTYGYVTVPGDDPLAAHACTALLELWCNTEGWVFGAMFIDTVAASEEGVVPGFTGLLDVLPVYARTAVLLVEPGDLSPRVGGALAKRTAIRHVGASLHVLADELAEALT